MTETEIRAAINACPPAANVKATIERPVKLRVAYKGVPLFKRTTMTVRIGVDNDHRKATQEARENGDRPAENQGLKGREWLVAPVLMRAIKSGKLLVRMEPSSNAKERSKPTFFVREAGIETEVIKADYEHMMLASEMKSKTYDGCFDVGIERVLRLHNVHAVEVVEEAEPVEA